MGRDAGFGELTRHGEHHRDGVLSGGDRVAEGGVHHDDTALGGSVFVDVVGADACSNDRLERFVSLECFRGYLDTATTDGPIVLGQRLAQFFFMLSLVFFFFNTKSRS